MTEVERYVTDLRALLGSQPASFEQGISGKITWLDQPARVPVSIACSGPRITALAGRIADGAILLQGVAPDLLARGLDWLKAGAESAGRDPTTLSITCWTPLGIGDTSAAGRDEVRARVASAVMQADPASFEGEEREAIQRLRAIYNDFKHASSKPDHAALISDRMVERYAVAGNATEIAEQLKTLMATQGIERIVLTPQGGSMPLDEVLRRFERHVMPEP
jgi:5,10-methylenetetrahydromethanopterin reductase